MLVLGAAWVGILVEILLATVLNSFFEIDDFEVAAFLFVGINMLLVLICINMFAVNIKWILLGSYILRLGLMFWDVYAKKVFPLPHSNTDSEGFRESAFLISYNMDLLVSDIYGGLYVKIIGVLFHLIGPHSLIGQYINVLLGVTIVLYAYRILIMLDVNTKMARLSAAVLSFFPFAMVFSAIFLRETFITAFVTFSLFYFTKWHRYGNNWNALCSTICILVASCFHAGVIGILPGYIFYYMFYQREKNRLIFNRNSVMVLILFICIGFVVITEFGDVILAKFQRMDEIDDMYDIANNRKGGAAYLNEFQINSLGEMILFGPLKVLYFLSSPLPTDWREGSDIIAFLLDGIVYLGLLIYSVLNVKYINRNPLAIGLAIALLCVVFIFGIGVSNAGTAMRHRNKIFPVIIVFCSIIADTKNILQSRK